MAASSSADDGLCHFDTFVTALYQKYLPVASSLTFFHAEEVLGVAVVRVVVVAVTSESLNV